MSPPIIYVIAVFVALLSLGAFSAGSRLGHGSRARTQTVVKGGDRDL
jgi:hypothetical protein